MINVNESIVTLLLRLHSKYSGRPDSYVPKYQRHGVSVTEDYHQSRIGDGCFFIEKVLDKIGDFDEACAESISACRQLLWPGKFILNTCRLVLGECFSNFALYSTSHFSMAR